MLLGIGMGTNTPSTLPTTVDIGVEQNLAPRVEGVGRHTVRSKSSVVDLSTVLLSDMWLLGDNQVRTRSGLCGAR